MKKLILYVLVFVLGFGACAYILSRTGYTPGGKESVMRALSGKHAPAVVKKGQNPIADAAARIGPAVVNIDTVAQRRVPNPFGGLEDFFGLRVPPQRQILVGQGSGVIIGKDGYVLTNNHVVAGVQDIKVRLADGRKFKGRLIGRDSKSDVAVLKVDARNLPFAELGNSDAIRVGDWVIAIGNPLGLGNTVTVGVVSATKRKNLLVSEGTVIEEAIQTDAAINLGNSGGALANIDGEVIGINTAIYSTEPWRGNIGLGFAIPINGAKDVAKRLISKGSVGHPVVEGGQKERPYLGILMSDLTGERAEWYGQNGYKGKGGAFIEQVGPGSPAVEAGLMPGDVITQIDKTKVRSAEDVIRIIKKGKVGQVIRLTVWRVGRTNVLFAKLGAAPTDVE